MFTTKLDDPLVLTIFHIDNRTRQSNLKVKAGPNGGRPWQLA